LIPGRLSGHGGPFFGILAADLAIQQADFGFQFPGAFFCGLLQKFLFYLDAGNGNPGGAVSLQSHRIIL